MKSISKNLLFLVILLPFSSIFALDLKYFLTVYKIENNFYYSIYPAYPVENVLETISKDFIVENKGQMNIEKIQTITCDEGEDIQKYHLGNSCKEIQKNIPHVYSYLQRNYQKDVLIFAIKTYIPHGIFLLLLWISYWIITTYSWSKIPRLLIGIKWLFTILSLTWYEIYSLKHQINPVFFSDILFADLIYWYYFFLYSVFYILLDIIFLSRRGIMTRLLVKNISKKQNTPVVAKIILRFLLYFASTIVFIHVLFFSIFPSYHTFSPLHYYIEKVLEGALFIGIAGILIKNRVIDYTASIIFLISCMYLFLSGISYYSSQEIVGFSSHFIQTPLILFACFCYIISGALYIREVFSLKKFKKASPESIQLIIDERKDKNKS